MDVGRRIITSVLSGLAAVFLVLGVVLGIALDLVFLYANASMTLMLLAVLAVFWLVWARADASRRRLLDTGVRVPAALVSSRPTGTRIADKVLQAHTFESRSAGRVIRAEARSFAQLPVGTEATIAYDAANPARATVVERFGRA